MTVSTAAGGLQERPLTFLSFSQVNRYLHCPEQYRLYYILRLRPKVPSAGLAFGSIVHEAIAEVLAGGDARQAFEDAWTEARKAELRYGDRESWEKLQSIGHGLLQEFARERRRITDIASIEQSFTVRIPALNLTFKGIVDLVARVDGRSSVVDFKTSGSAYDDHEAALSDQLTAYQLAEPQAEQSALCVLVKTREPRVEWQFTKRSGEHLAEYLDKVRLVSELIRQNHFYKRPGKWCSWCDYLPVCLGDRVRMNETLVQLE